jgi:hypothetical protein
MTIAISEILKQVELLSAAEQEELAHKLMERMRQHSASQHHNGQTPDETGHSSPPAQVSAASRSDEGAEDDFIEDVFSLNRVPPKHTYMARAKFHYVGRGKPMPYELDDDLRDEKEGAS